MLHNLYATQLGTMKPGKIPFRQETIPVKTMLPLHTT